MLYCWAKPPILVFHKELSAYKKINTYRYLIFCCKYAENLLWDDKAMLLQ